MNNTNKQNIVREIIRLMFEYQSVTAGEAPYSIRFDMSERFAHLVITGPDGSEEWFSSSDILNTDRPFREAPDALRSIIEKVSA